MVLLPLSLPTSLALLGKTLTKVKCMSTHSTHLAVSIKSGLRAERCADAGNINDCGESNHHAELLAGVREEPCQTLKCECVSLCLCLNDYGECNYHAGLVARDTEEVLSGFTCV